jgi:purine-binding chemotaxis protein CheW
VKDNESPLDPEPFAAIDGPAAPSAPEAEGSTPESGDVSALLEDWLASVASAPVDTAAPPVLDPEPTARPALPAEPAPGTPLAPTLFDALTDERVQPEDAAIDAAESAAPVAPQHRLVLFVVSGTTYGVQDALVTEVGRVPKITAVPRMPAWLRGVTSLRGDIVSVVDVRTFLGLEATSLHTGRLLVVRLPDEEFSVALLVDEVQQIASVPVDAVKPPASPLEGALAPFLTGVTETGGRLVVVLDLERLLRSAEIRQFDDRRDAEPAA